MGILLSVAVSTRYSNGKLSPFPDKTYIDGITRLYYCNYTQELSINCTETCKPLIVSQPPMTVVFYPERRVPNLNLIFRGTKYTVSCPAGKVFSGTNESYRNYTCDYNGKYYTETKGDLTSAETDCVDSVGYLSLINGTFYRLIPLLVSSPLRHLLPN